jgi:hypothetical protein
VVVVLGLDKKVKEPLFPSILDTVGLRPWDSYYSPSKIPAICSAVNFILLDYISQT